MPDPNASGASGSGSGGVDFDPFGLDRTASVSAEVADLAEALRRDAIAAATADSPARADSPAPSAPPELATDDAAPPLPDWPSFDAPLTEPPPRPAGDLTVEGLLDDLERVTRERDSYLDDSRRLAAEFSNFRRQTEKRQSEMEERAGSRIAEQLLPVLDACDGARAHGRSDVEPVHNMLVASLEKLGLSVLNPIEQPFDPNCHEAVMHEEGDGTGPTVAEVLRTGYLWHGRVLRPALVKVRG